LKSRTMGEEEIIVHFRERKEVHWDKLGAECFLLRHQSDIETRHTFTKWERLQGEDSPRIPLPWAALGVHIKQEILLQRVVVRDRLLGKRELPIYS